jgi:leishmanolysin
MSGVAINGNFDEYITPMTLALFEDLGWYIANYLKVINSAYGYDAGCAFVKEKFIANSTIPSYSKAHFCNTYDKSDTFHFDPTHTAIAACDFIHFENHPDLPPPAP